MLENDFNLPVYINIPLFLYQDKSLDRSALLLSGFFYSLHTSGKKIKVSNQYLSSMLNVSERQVRNALEVLEKNSYIVRQESGTRRKILWCHNPDSEIILVEESNNPELNLRPTRNYPSGLPGTKPPPYNKEDNKEDNKALCASSSKSTITHSTAFEEFWTLYPKKKAKKKFLKKVFTAKY